MARVSRMELSQGEVVQCVCVHQSGAPSPCHIIANQNSSHPVFPDSEGKLEVKDFTFKAIS